MEETWRILLVEDDEVDRIAVKRCLARSELEVHLETASSIAAGREALLRLRFDCLILDYRLPDGDAMQLLRNATAKVPPVIILTGHGSALIAVELMKAGAADYLPKDELTPSRISQSVRNALRVRRSEEALRRAYEDLEARVVERTAALAAANRELEQEMADRQRAEERARRHLEQLAHVNRLNILGEMAAGIAHELHQPLGAITNYASGCLRRTEAEQLDPVTLRRSLQRIAEQAERAGKIVRRLRALVTTREPEVALADINQLLREVVALEEPEARHRDVEIVFALGASLPPVPVDAIQIQQVVLNLVRNGLEAMQETSEEAAERGCLAISTRALVQGVEVAVTDRGPGCAPQVLERIFDPFFTTKEGGMGMGLAICRSIIEAHGGELRVEVNPEGGLCFRFTLAAEDEGRGEEGMGKERKESGEGN